MSTLLITMTIFLAPSADQFKKGTLRFGEGSIGGGEEQDEIRARHEVSGQLLVLANDGVGTWGVHNMDVTQQLDWGGCDDNSLGLRLLGSRVAVLQDMNAGGRRRNTFTQDGLAGDGVDEGALAGVEFAHHDEEEQLVELTNG
jgi:hypothetical protein